MFLVFLIYVTFFVNTFKCAGDFDSTVFLFWNNNKFNLTAQQIVRINNFFCMGVALHTKWILVHRVCFESDIQLTSPEMFAAVPIMNQTVFDETLVEPSSIFEVEKIYLNITRDVNSGIVILKLKSENLFAKNITKFAASKAMSSKDSCKTLIWNLVTNKRNKAVLMPNIYNAIRTENCTYEKGDVCVTSNITKKLCNTAKSSLVQCKDLIQGISGYSIYTNLICLKSNQQLTLAYADFGENIYKIIVFLLSLKDDKNEANYLHSSKVLIMTAVIISTYRLIKNTV